MKIGFIVLAFGAAALLAPMPAAAWGALAVGVPNNVAKDGFAYGINSNAPTEELAREKAISTCRGTEANATVHSQSSDPAKALCTVVTAFQHQCAVVAEDPAAGTPGIGWAVAASLDVATQQAMDNCKATAGATRQQYCKRDAYNCDPV
jgi:hypothetical protein